MGNIVTPDQGLLPLPAYGIAPTPYPWWLTAALAIWALLALLCCWLLLLLYLLRYCCRWWRHRQYAADRMSLRERFFGAGGAAGGRTMYATKDQHFATAPLPPVPPYAVGNGNAGAFRDVFERETVQDEFYGNRMPYVTSGAVGAGNSAFDVDSESFSEEEINRGKDRRLLANGLHPITVVSDKSAGGVTENVETNIQRNITKNYYINEEQNYFIQKDPQIQHEQEIQRLPAPAVTTINMAAERITDNQNWENANANEDFDNQKPKEASTEIVATDPSLFRQDVKYEQPPNILTHRPITPEVPRVENRQLRAERSIISDDGSTTSEMSGHDSESIYETIRVFTPKKQVLPRLEDEDEYRTAGTDEVEIEIQDLVRLQRTNPKSISTYDDILSSTNMSRQDIRPRVSSSLSSSSTLNNLMPSSSQQENLVTGKEEKEETVTETVKTQQIQTTFRQIGQNLDDSAFFIPLTSSSTSYEGQQNDDRKIIIPISMSSIRHEEQPALQQF